MYTCIYYYRDVHTFNGLADSGEELDTTSVTVNLAGDKEFRFMGISYSGKGQDAEGGDNESDCLRHFGR